MRNPFKKLDLDGDDVMMFTGLGLFVVGGWTYEPGATLVALGVFLVGLSLKRASS